MSNKYLIVSTPEQVPPYDPKMIADGLGMTLLGFLGPLLLELDHWLDKRLLRTLVQSIEAILTFRDRVNGLLLSELGNYLDAPGKGGGTKRLSRRLALSEVDRALHRAVFVVAGQRTDCAVGSARRRGVGDLG